MRCTSVRSKTEVYVNMYVCAVGAPSLPLALRPGDSPESPAGVPDSPAARESGFTIYSGFEEMLSS